MENSVPTGTPPKTWHIFWQAAMGRDLLSAASGVDRIRKRLLDAHRRQGRVLLDYLLTPTEIHVVSSLQCEESPREIARAVANVVSRWVRDLDGVRGPVFAGRYRAHAVDSDEALANEFRMLAWRPVAMELCRTPTHYTNSALRTTLGIGLAMGFDSRGMLRRFGDSVPTARSVLRAWVARRPSAVEMRQWELTHGLLLAIGNVGPGSQVAREVRGTSAALLAASEPHSIDGALRLLERWVLAKLGLREGKDLSHVPGAAGARGRALVACLAVQSELCSAAFVARYFNRAKATLSEQMAASRRRPGDQQMLGTPMARIVEEAFALPAGGRCQ